MAAIPTVTVVSNRTTNVEGNRRVVFGRITFPDLVGPNLGYTTGGVGIDPLQFGLTILDALKLDLGRKTDGSAAIEARLAPSAAAAALLVANPTWVNVVFPPYKTKNDITNPAALLQAFWAAGSATEFAEVANSTDLSLYPILFEAIGV
jgi:hypothetical protein